MIMNNAASSGLQKSQLYPSNNSLDESEMQDFFFIVVLTVACTELHWLFEAALPLVSF